MKKFKQAVVFIVALSLIMSAMIINSSAVDNKIKEETIRLVDTAAGTANGHTNGLLVLVWENYPGLTFTVNQNELLTGITFYTPAVADKPLTVNLYKWNTSRADKELLEKADVKTVKDGNVVVDFKKMYTPGNYFFEIVTTAANGTDCYLKSYKQVISDRNVVGYLYSKTFAEKDAATPNFGLGFDSSIKLLTNVSASAITFVQKYNEAKAEGATIKNQAKYDAVMNAVGPNLKSFLMRTSDADLGLYTANLTASLAEQNSGISEEIIRLVDASAGGAKGHQNGVIVLVWANYPGMTFTVNENELLTGMTFFSPLEDGKPLKVNLYKWNTSRDDKEVLESIDVTTVKDGNVVVNFSKVYPAGNYFFDVVTTAANGTSVYLSSYKQVIAGRNVVGQLYDKTFAEKCAEANNSEFGLGYDSSIKLLTGVSANAKAFINKYYEAKAEGVTVYDQAKFDAVMSAVGTDLKAFVLSKSDADLGTQLSNLNASLTKPDANPATGDAGYVLLVLVAAAFAVVLKKNKVRV